VIAPYSVGDRVEILKRKVWTPGEVVEVNTHHSPPIMYRVLRDSGGCVWGGREMLRRPVERRSLKLATPEVSEEADSFEAARERSTGSARAELVAVPKAPKPFRSRAHLKSVAEGGCCVPLCTAPASAHHMENEGGSKKCDDRLTAPLCDVHHLDWWHGKGHLPGLDRTGSLALMWEACARGLAMKMEAGR
jgi:hypothetical protein